MGAGEVIVILLGAAFWSCGWILLGRVLRARCQRLAGHGVAVAAEVSVIIPARDEAHNLPRLLESLRSQEVVPGEVIVVDDGSQDGTAGIAEGFGVRVIQAGALPEGWRGKPWACWQGAAAAKGGILLFLDADTWFEPDGFGCLLGAWNGGAVSACPHHVVERPYEQLSAFFNLLMVAGTVPDGLFGQCMLVDRSCYENVGGHEAVKGRVLENFRLARLFREAGVPVRGLSGRHSISFRMYPGGYRSLVEGWTKGFASGAGEVEKSTLALTIGWLSGLMLPLAAWAFSPVLAGLLYLVFAVLLGALLRQVGSFRLSTSLLYPIPLMYYFGLFAWSMFRSGKAVTWKGRNIHGD